MEAMRHMMNNAKKNVGTDVFREVQLLWKECESTFRIIIVLLVKVGSQNDEVSENN